MRYTLVIVDMQPQFIVKCIKERSIIEANVLKQINKAIADNQPIIFLEFDKCGRSINRIIPKNYKQKTISKKSQQSGEQNIIRIINKKCWSKNIRVCGIFTSQCVKATVSDLTLNYNYKISVIHNACADNEYDAEIVALNTMKLKGAKII